MGHLLVVVVITVRITGHLLVVVVIAVRITGHLLVVVVIAVRIMRLSLGWHVCDPRTIMFGKPV